MLVLTLIINRTPGKAFNKFKRAFCLGVIDQQLEGNFSIYSYATILS